MASFVCPQCQAQVSLEPGEQAAGCPCCAYAQNMVGSQTLPFIPYVPYTPEPVAPYPSYPYPVWISDSTTEIFIGDSFVGSTGNTIDLTGMENYQFSWTN